MTAQFIYSESTHKLRIIISRLKSTLIINILKKSTLFLQEREHSGEVDFYYVESANYWRCAPCCIPFFMSYGPIKFQWSHSLMLLIS